VNDLHELFAFFNSLEVLFQNILELKNIVDNLETLGVYPIWYSAA